MSAADAFKQLIRKIVAEEVKKQLPAMLSEMYIRKIVSEGIDEVEPVMAKPQASEHDKQKLRKTLRERLLDEDDDQPYVQEQQVSRPRQQKSPLLQGPMADLFEGTVPIGEEPTGHVEVPMEAFGNMDFSRMIGLIDKTESNDRGPISETQEMTERRLKRQRDALEVKVST